MRPSVAVALLALVLAGGACEKERSGPRELRSAEVVLRLPGDALYSMTSAPDGTLFITTFGGALYRSRDEGRRWDRVAQQEGALEPALLYMYAPSRATLFAVRSGGSEVYRWDEGKGLRAEPTPVAGRWASCGHTHVSASFARVWGRSAREVYALGQYGLVLRFDGARWAVERTPVSRLAGPCGDIRARLEAVGGDGRYVYAAGTHAVRRSPGGTWELLPPLHRPGEVSVVRGIVAGDAGPVFAGGFSKRGDGSTAEPIRFFGPLPHSTAAGSRWETLWAGGPYVEFFEAGTSAPGNPPVFFDMASPNLFVLHGKRLRRYRAPELTGIRGAAAVGRYLVVAGERDTTALVVRGRLRRRGRVPPRVEEWLPDPPSAG